MAHVLELGALTDELVTLITSISAETDPSRYSAHRESALRALRLQNHPRTNQFDVTRQLGGLEEKFRVYNEDSLADALRERLDRIAALDVKWTPDILQLLLELSDQPVSKSKLKDLDRLKDLEQDTRLALKWQDLVAEDPLLRERSVWQNVDFGAEESDGEDGFEDSRSDLSRTTEDTTRSSVYDKYTSRPEYAVDTASIHELSALRDQQFWQKTPNAYGVPLETVKKPITELQAIREVLFMLGGLPTSLFESDVDDPTTIRPSKGYSLKHASADAFLKLAKSFADNGSSLNRIRSWVKIPQPNPLIQGFQSALLRRIIDFEARLSGIQQRLVSPTEDIIISLLAVQAELATHILPLVRLSEITRKLEAEPYAHAFRYLELLYDEACTSQMGGDDDMYAFMGRVFFDCFRIYLRPMRLWMEEGELAKDDNVFFVSEISGGADLKSLWESRFKIRKTQNGLLHAPRFLQAAANKIFNTGKSVVVLKHLNQYDSMRSTGGASEPVLDFDAVCNPADQLATFPEIFDVAFDAWVQSKHHHASSMLRKTLFDSCGLHTALDALSHIYFMADGITASAFTNTIFDKLDTLNTSWNDQFTLTELSRSTFGSIQSINPDRLRTRILAMPRKHCDVSSCRRTVKVLAVVEFRYHLSWPIQIILTPATIPSYKRIFTFLLQVRRTSHILSRQRLINDGLTTNSSSDERALYYSLRTALIWFTQSLYYYLTSLVLEPSSQRMRAELKEAEDVDAMISVHSRYVKNVLDQALLGSKLELIHKTILKILDLGIKLEDAQSANAVADRVALEQQQEMMDLSLASLGLQTPRRQTKQLMRVPKSASKNTCSSADEDEDVDVDLSILSSAAGDQKEESYVEKLRQMKADFDRLARFVASGLKGVARAGAGDEARRWEALGEIFESGLGTGTGMGMGMGNRRDGI
ncbi:gamma-tubulin complex component GCP [Marssonina coronariae]|uniref:Spindle pole body component n=1 Tax=Diplocarpon coronariae TaxID=2795749 RepID=A0A218ZDG5_9HELO|nr:spc97/Spc98 family protein [Diplocarpon mali]OWP05335.1 gamma-tubulin complex component GCP [Marssonina coronariae]